MTEQKFGIESASGQEMEFVAIAEPWCRYELEDGTVVKVRIMLIKVLRDGFNPDGTPKMLLNCQQVIDVTHTEHIRREIEARQRGE